MNFSLRLIFCFLLIAFISCESDKKTTSQKVVFKSGEHAILHFLFFKKENKLEVWATKKNSDIQLIQSFQSVFSKNTPIGIYQLSNESNDHLLLESPNEYYDYQIGYLENEEIQITIKNKQSSSRESIVINEDDLKQIKSFMSNEIKTQVLIFPNDLRDDGKFEPCYGCPHQVAELYSSLELHLVNFSNKN